MCVSVSVCARRKYDGEMRIKFCINILFARQDDRFGDRDIRKHVDDEPGRIRTWLAGDVSLFVHQQQYHASDREKTCHDCVDRRSEPKKRMDGYRRFSSTQDESSMLFVVFRCTSCSMCVRMQFFVRVTLCYGFIGEVDNNYSKTNLKITTTFLKLNIFHIVSMFCLNLLKAMLP